MRPSVANSLARRIGFILYCLIFLNPLALPLSQALGAVPSAQPAKPADAEADNKIQQQVSYRMLQDGFLAAMPITVSVRDARVRLSGSVASAYEKDLATRLAREVNGATDIDNELSVDALHADGTTDIAIADRIWASLIRDSPLLEQTIDVTVSHQVATLTGTVYSRKEEAAAVLDAYRAGARRVENQLHLMTSE
jgi:osmotically-inducible protein OsmY